MSSKGLPSGTIERVFSVMVSYYGATFTRQWDKVDPESMKRVWGRELALLSPDEIARGLEACRRREFPPTLPEFVKLCRPTLDPEVAFHEAVRVWPSRVGWSDPAIYWAALALGNDVRKHPYSALRGRWRHALERAQANPRPLPEPAEQPRLEYSPPTAEQEHLAASRFFAFARKLGIRWGQKA